MKKVLLSFFLLIGGFGATPSNAVPPGNTWEVINADGSGTRYRMEYGYPTSFISVVATRACAYCPWQIK